jgi:hypothetical protein
VYQVVDRVEEPGLVADEGKAAVVDTRPGLSMPGFNASREPAQLSRYLQVSGFPRRLGMMAAMTTTYQQENTMALALAYPLASQRRTSTISQPARVRRGPISLDATTPAWMALPETERADLAARVGAWLEDFAARHTNWQTASFG